MMDRKWVGQSGFTVLELSITLAIINILTFSGLVSFNDNIQTAKTMKCLSNRGQIQRSELLYALEHDSGSQSFGNLIEQGYLNLEPQCPSQGVYVIAGSTGTAQTRVVVCSLHGWFGTAGGLAIKDMLTIERGQWDVTDDTLVPTGRGRHTAFLNAGVWEDYEIRVNATVFSGRGHEVYYRSDGNRSVTGYSAQYARNNRNLLIVRIMTAGRQGRVLARVRVPAGYLVYNQSHTLSVRVEGNSHTIKIDGQVMASFEDSTYTSGPPGLGTWSNPNLVITYVGTTSL